MKRTGWVRPAYQPPAAVAPVKRPAAARAVAPARLSIVALAAQVVISRPKECVVVSKAYRRLVAALPCKHCGISGYSQAAHPNMGKGAGIKTDDRLCFPLCTVHPGVGGLVSGCHERFDQGALFSKAVRREIEPVWGADTRRAIKAQGKWPARLQEWPELTSPVSTVPPLEP